MEYLGRSSESYSVSIIQSETAEGTDTDSSGLALDSQYIIFQVLKRESGETPSDLELEENKEEIALGLKAIIPESSKAGLVLLYDAEVKVIEADTGLSWEVIEPNPFYTRWEEPGGHRERLAWRE